MRAPSSSCTAWSTPAPASKRSRRSSPSAARSALCRWYGCRRPNTTSLRARSMSARWASWCRWSTPPSRRRASFRSRAIRPRDAAAPRSVLRTTTIRAATWWIGRDDAPPATAAPVRRLIRRSSQPVSLRRGSIAADVPDHARPDTWVPLLGFPVPGPAGSRSPRRASRPRARPTRHAPPHRRGRPDGAAADRQRQRSGAQPLPAAVQPAGPVRPGVARSRLGPGAAPAGRVLGARGSLVPPETHACCAGGCAAARGGVGRHPAIGGRAPRPGRRPCSPRSPPHGPDDRQPGRGRAGARRPAGKDTGAGTGRWSSSALEFLFFAGEVTVGRTHHVSSSVATRCPSGCCRVRCSTRPTPTTRTRSSSWSRIAARAHGVASEPCLRDYFRLQPVDAQAAIADAGRRRRAAPRHGRGLVAPGYLHHEARLPRAVRARALLCPFDPLVWERARVEALFGFRYRIEIYVPADEAGARLLRAALPARRPAGRPGRPQVRPAGRRWRWRAAGPLGLGRGRRAAGDGRRADGRAARDGRLAGPRRRAVERRGDLAAALAAPSAVGPPSAGSAGVGSAGQPGVQVLVLPAAVLGSR